MSRLPINPDFSDFAELKGKLHDANEELKRLRLHNHELQESHRVLNSTLQRVEAERNEWMDRAERHRNEKEAIDAAHCERISQLEAEASNYKDGYEALSTKYKELEAERDAALAQVNEAKIVHRIQCLYCDFRFTKERTNAECDNERKAHALICPENPMRQLERDLQAANQRADDAVAALNRLGARVIERWPRESLKNTDLGEALDAGEAVIRAIHQPKESGA